MRTGAVLSLAAAAALHNATYAVLRVGSTTLFTASLDVAVMPAAFACTTPLALAMMAGLHWALRFGARAALTGSTLACALAFVLLWAAHPLAPAPVAFALLVLRDAYFQFLTCQHWTFLTTFLSAAELARWFGPVQGLTSVASTLASAAVGPLVALLGGSGPLVALAGVGLLPAAALGDLAYALEGAPPAANKEEEEKQQQEEEGVLQAAGRLLRAEPLLRAMFAVIVVNQALSCVLQLAFESGSRRALPDDDERSAAQGVFWAAVNGAAGLCQFLLVPAALRLLSVRACLLAQAAVTAAACVAAVAEPARGGALAFGLFKAIEYSFFAACFEMLYAPLPAATQHLGKQIVSTLGYRGGKTVAALALALLGASTELPAGLIALVLAGVWWGSLSLLPGPGSGSGGGSGSTSGGGKGRKAE